MNPTIDDLCKAIQTYEGYFAPGENPKYPHGTPAWRNHNPGNLRFAYQQGAYGKPGEFAVFSSYETGYKALYNQILVACTGKSRVYKPTMTLIGFFNTYSPSSDHNDPNAYAEFVAKQLGVSTDFIIKNLTK